MPPEAKARPRGPQPTSDRGMLVLQQKLSILTGTTTPGARRNPALDVLTGRVPDERLTTLRASLLTSRPSVESVAQPSAPTAMVLPVAAIRMAAVARSTRPAPSPWLSTNAEGRPHLELIVPPPSRWSRVPWLGPFIDWLRAESRPYKSTARSHRAHLAP